MLQKRKNVPEDLPKMTKLMVDGKALYIHRANYQINDKNCCRKNLNWTLSNSINVFDMKAEKKLLFDKYKQLARKNKLNLETINGCTGWQQ